MRALSHKLQRSGETTKRAVVADVTDHCVGLNESGGKVNADIHTGHTHWVDSVKQLVG